MKTLAALLFLLAAAPVAAEPPQPPSKVTPEVRAALLVEVRSIERTLLTSPGDAELYARLGFVHSRLDQADDARLAFENAVRLDPKKAPAWYMLGLIYEKLGLKDKALAAWRACLENTQDPRARDTAQKHIHQLSRP